MMPPPAPHLGSGAAMGALFETGRAGGVARLAALSPGTWWIFSAPSQEACLAYISDEQVLNDTVADHV